MLDPVVANAHGFGVPMIEAAQLSPRCNGSPSLFDAPLLERRRCGDRPRHAGRPAPHREEATA